LNGPARLQDCGAFIKSEQQLLAIIYERQGARAWINSLYLPVYRFRLFNESGCCCILARRAKRAAEPEPV
jgi:hypothetical protein